MNLCDECKGACCEGIIMPPYDDDDLDRWLSFHGTVLPNGSLHLNCPCKHLSSGGRCSIYETRPALCREYKVDGPACRRTREMKKKLKARPA